MAAVAPCIDERAHGREDSPSIADGENTATIGDAARQSIALLSIGAAVFGDGERDEWFVSAKPGATCYTALPPHL